MNGLIVLNLNAHCHAMLFTQIVLKFARTSGVPHVNCPSQTLFSSCRLVSTSCGRESVDFMAKSKQLASQQKNALRQHEADEALILHRVLKEALNDADVLGPLHAFQTYNRNGLHVSLSAHSSETLPDGVLMWARQLVQRNMESIYAQDNFPWKPREKLQELSHSHTRFLLAWNVQAQDTTAVSRPSLHHNELAATCEVCYQPTPSRSDLPVAFVAYRFEAEVREPVLYVYEVQLEAIVQGKGLGRFLMQLTELIAARHHMIKVMLTVQHSNAAARKMYAKLGYVLDPSSPLACDPSAKELYDILQKPCKRK